MKQEEELLLRDLCARLPYGVKVGATDNDGSLENVWDILWYNTFTEDLKLTHSIEDDEKTINISEVKPYLFPLSSMTEEQKREYQYITERWMYDSSYSYSIGDSIDWLNKNHFDYRHLIERNLAIDATNLGIYKKAAD